MFTYLEACLIVSEQTAARFLVVSAAFQKRVAEPRVETFIILGLQWSTSLVQTLHFHNIQG